MIVMSVADPIFRGIIISAFFFLFFFLLFGEAVTTSS